MSLYKSIIVYDFRGCAFSSYFQNKRFTLNLLNVAQLRVAMSFRFSVASSAWLFSFLKKPIHMAASDPALLVAITEDPLDLNAIYAHVVAPECGGLSLFVGKPGI